jgi:hypothetical protein
MPGDGKMVCHILFCLMLIIINAENKQENLREENLQKKGREIQDSDPSKAFFISSCSFGNES